MRALSRPVLLVVLSLAIGPATAEAADVISPADNELVSSRPELVFDIARGSASVELSKTADVKTAGDNVGAFVDPVASDFIIIGGDSPPPYVFNPGFPTRLEAGRYFWHAKVNDSADDGETGGPPVPWGPTRRLTVVDERPVIEGYTVRAERLRKRGTCDRVRLRGRMVYQDNAPDDEAARMTITARVAGRTVGRVREITADGVDTFDGIICTRASRLSLRLTLRDAGDNLADSPPRTVQVRRARSRRTAATAASHSTCPRLTVQSNGEPLRLALVRNGPVSCRDARRVVRAFFASAERGVCRAPACTEASPKGWSCGATALGIRARTDRVMSCTRGSRKITAYE